ncbi:MAG TPA: hypothetical protein HPQ03_08285 [Deltaproteobacteria bacterium]|nr:hypothetical protein [Deltaproteobacteria bacterium]
MKEILEKIKPYWSVLAGVILLTSFIATAFQTDETVSLPKKLIGEWTTTFPKYANRFFVLEKRLITIGTAKDDFEVFLISGVQMNQGSRGGSYTLTYSDTQGIKYEFTFHYFPDEGNGGAIRIKNRNETVWVRKKPEDSGS